MKKLIIVLILLLSCGLASADINVNVTGWWHDGGAFNASGTPIQAAVDVAVAGDTVYVWNGTYTEGDVQVVTDSVTLEGESKDVTFLNNRVIVGNRGTPVLVEYVTIKNINSTGSLYPEYAYHSVFSDNEFSDLYIANDLDAPLNCTFLNNSFNIQSGIEYITNSVFCNNTFNGLVIGTGIKNNTFEDNTFYPSNPAHLFWYDSSAHNNTFVGSVFKGSPADYYIYFINVVTDVIFINSDFEYAGTALYIGGGGVSFMQTDNSIFVCTDGNDYGFTIANTTATNLTAGGYYDYRPFWITPSTGELNITSTPFWNTTDDYKKQFNITGTTGTFTYTIGDMLPNAPATTSTTAWSDTKTANASGYITGTYNGGWGDLEFTVKSITPPIINLHNKSGCFWVNHTWDNTADAYNISVNNVWYNSTNSYYFNDSYSKYEWQNISVWAYNNSMGISNICIIQNTQVSIYYPPFFLPIINLLHSIICIFEPIPAILLVIGETLIYIAGISFVIWIIFSIVRTIMKVIK